MTVTMKVQSTKLELKTEKPIQLIDITDQVKKFVTQSGIPNGLLHVASLHTTAAIRINEACGKLEKDVEEFFKRLAPPKADYAHNHETIDGRNNAHSHLLEYLLGASETISISKGELVLGGWQSVFFVELDGPRNKREVILTVMGES